MTRDEALTLSKDLAVRISRPPKETRSDTPLARQASRAFHDQIRLDKCRLAAAFGEQFGWTWVSDRRGAQHLRGKRPQWHQQDIPPHSDHSSSYRLGRRAMALVEQPYASQAHLAEMRGWADERGLVMTIPDWPSWWFPGSTTLCVFTLPDVAAILDGVAS